MSFEGRLKDQIYWYLSKRKPFIINDHYQIELLFIDKTNNSAKILITNLKNNEKVESTMEFGDDIR